MRKFLCLSLLYSCLACSLGTEVNQALHDEMSLKRQEMFQEQQFYQLDNDSLALEYKKWLSSLQKAFPGQDPIIEEHQKSLTAYQEIFKEHQTKLTAFIDSLAIFTRILERHSLGRVSDEQLQEAYKGIQKSYKNLQSAHQSLLEDHQTLKDATETLLAKFQEKTS